MYYLFVFLLELSRKRKEEGMGTKKNLNLHIIFIKDKLWTPFYNLLQGPGVEDTF